MKFKKLDDKTVCCMVSTEDLSDNNITIEDFIQNKDKVQDFLEEVVKLQKKRLDLKLQVQCYPYRLWRCIRKVS